MEEYILTTNCLTKSFGSKKAVDSVSVHIKQGAVYGFIGRNGSGKTTFLRMVCGLATPNSGSISLMGATDHGLRNVRNRVGCLIESPGLFPDMTAADNLKARCLAAGTYSKAHVEELLKLVGLADVKKKKTKNFSLGMKQRLGIAMTLVADPEFLVLDEPINGLDPQGIVEVRETIHKLSSERNITILISSHILEELSKIATDYGIINNGALIKEISSEDLHNECSERLEIRVDEVNAACNVLKEMGISEFSLEQDNRIVLNEQIENSAVINKKLVSAGLMVSEISKKGEALEDYYIRMTGGVSVD